MIRKMRESNDNTFYCAECTYDKSNGTMFLYTTDIIEVRGSVKPKDSMKVEGGFLVRRKYFRSEYEAQEYIDSLPNATPMNRNESFCIGRTYTGKHRRFIESQEAPFYGVKLYDPDSGEYVVYWSQSRNIVREIYDTLRDHTWIRYDDLYDFVDQINPKFNKFTWDDIGFEWDDNEAFIEDGVHESEGEIDIIYELPLDTKRRAESISRRRRSNESFRMSKSNGKRGLYESGVSDYIAQMSTLGYAFNGMIGDTLDFEDRDGEVLRFYGWDEVDDFINDGTLPSDNFDSSWKRYKGLR